jgi:hypothetical protein
MAVIYASSRGGVSSYEVVNIATAGRGVVATTATTGGVPERGRAWWVPRWWELVPEAVLATGLTIFLVDETDAATSAFRSGRAIGLMAVVAIGWVVARVVLALTAPWAAVRVAVFAVAAAAVLAVVVLPAYDDETVVEAFPGDTATSTTAPTTTAVPPTTDAATPTTAPTTATTLAVGPVRVSEAALEGIDHRASGAVVLYRQPDGAYVVGLEEIDVQPGPDYDVYVVPGADRDDLGDATRLDDLRGNRGTQFYDVPDGLDLGAGPWTLLIWCETFSVPIANATLA